MTDYQKYVKYKTKYLNEVSRRQTAGNGSIEDLTSLIWNKTAMTKLVSGEGYGMSHRVINNNWTPYIRMDGQNIVPTELLKGIRDTKNSRDQTLLYSAARNCNEELIKVLVEAKADINAPCGPGSNGLSPNEGDTVMHGIAFGNCDIPKKLELLKYLISNGADINITNKKNETPYALFLIKINEEWENL